MRVVFGAGREIPPETLVDPLGTPGAPRPAALAECSDLGAARDPHARLASRDRERPETARFVGGG